MDLVQIFEQDLVSTNSNSKHGKKWRNKSEPIETIDTKWSYSKRITKRDDGPVRSLRHLCIGVVAANVTLYSMEGVPSPLRYAVFKRLSPTLEHTDELTALLDTSQSSIDLSGINPRFIIRKELLDYIAKNCRNLTLFKIPHLFMDTPDFPLAYVCNPSLTHLDLTGLRTPTNHTINLRFIMERLEKIKILKMNSPKVVNYTDYMSLSDIVWTRYKYLQEIELDASSDTVFILKGCFNLKRVTILKTRGWKRYLSSDESLNIRCAESLTHLTLRELEINTEFLVKILMGNQFPKLKYFDFSRNIKLADSELSHSPKHAESGRTQRLLHLCFDMWWHGISSQVEENSSSWAQGHHSNFSRHNYQVEIPRNFGPVGISVCFGWHAHGSH
eukprot:TRINITY_DN10646_c0_g1_i2.p1 TRINITY_DN10646_c0_g1~~TRINITY_DN10646_c0_g1_i2.p1  ORF type:complete len:433 (+),score=101.85 TRINITY_DN10646_c0_g1_i2:141-1301(+)